MHKMNLQDWPFEAINNGQKTIEMRLYDEKRQKIKIGDIIEFFNNSNDIIKTQVIGIHRFKNFDELYQNFNKEKLGYKDNETANPNDMAIYYSLDDIKKYGVVGIEIKKI